jgi:hypothetical protein
LVLPVLRGKKLQKKINMSFGTMVDWEENMKRMRKCDVYVERMRLERNGFQTGVWGIQAMEAAALGKIVITNDLHRKAYEKRFGPCPMIVANAPIELSKIIDDLITWPHKKIVNLQKETRRWVETVHGYKAVGKELERILL